MPIRNQGWYDRNESRPYPLSDEASGVGDDGVRLPGRMLADLHLAFPLSAGRRAFLASWTSTPSLVSLTILAADSASSVSGFTPLAALSLPRPAEPHRQYALEPLLPGVLGWVTLGRGSSEPHAARFSGPAQSVLLPSTARAYRDPPVADVGKLGTAAALSGLVRLQAGADLEIVRECREIPLRPGPAGDACTEVDSVLRNVVVVRLKESVVVGTAAGNVFSAYLGPCGGRPESETCGEPVPIEALGAVVPDCCGNVTVLLRGCARISAVDQQLVVDEESSLAVVDDCGVLVDCGLGLADVCQASDKLPDAEGNLPGEAEDLCEVRLSL